MQNYNFKIIRVISMYLPVRCTQTGLYISIAILFSTFYFLLSGFAFASETSGTIISGGNNGYAWSNQAGWVNFGATNGNINITDSGITGNAWSINYGWINMSPTNGGVTVAVNGALSGYAWGSGLGWINFSGVFINSSGKFTGQASGTTIGALTFDCANCSATTDFRAQNFRTVAPAPTTIVSSDGGGGSMPNMIPPHINAYNVPLQIDNDQQSGTLTQAFMGDLSAGVDVSRGSIGGRIIITVTAATVDSSIVPTEIKIISDALFNVTAADGVGNPIHTFASPIQIALQVPEELQGRNDIGVYFFDEENEQRWKRVQDAQFDNNIARFFVNHLTLFGIFSGLDLPQFIEPFFPISQETGISEGTSEEEAGVSAPSGITEIKKEEEMGAFEGGSSEEAEEEFLPAQLFDINLEIENTKIAGLKDLVARVLFTSFGRVPTPVDLTFDILNESGEKVYSAKDNITVQTQAVLTKRFADAEEILEIGKYTLLVTTLYNVDVTDEFRQDFEIAGEGVIKKPFWRSLRFWVISTIILIIIFFVVVKKIKDDEKTKETIQD